MADPQSILLLPLRSNAAGLVAGAPVVAARRRLKFASVVFDRLLIESGTVTVDAGPGGSSTFVTHGELDAARFQTPRQRALAQRQGFILSIGQEEEYGVPAPSMTPFIQSESTVAWSATLMPFLREFPSGCDWVDVVVSKDPTGETADTIKRWVRRDEANPALRTAMPEQFVRGAVVKHANRDLGIAADSGIAVMQDRLHQQVAERRFEDDEGWRGYGFAVPLLFPVVGDMPWEGIAELRRSPHMRAFRGVLCDVEAEALAEAGDGDLEAAAHHVYERYLARANGHLDNVASVVRRAAAGFVIGGATGVLTSGIAGWANIATGATIGTGISTVDDVRSFLRTRRRRGWVSVHLQLDPRA